MNCQQSLTNSKPKFELLFFIHFYMYMTKRQTDDDLMEKTSFQLHLTHKKRALRRPNLPHESWRSFSAVVAMWCPIDTQFIMLPTQNVKVGFFRSSLCVWIIKKHFKTYRCRKLLEISDKFSIKDSHGENIGLQIVHVIFSVDVYKTRYSWFQFYSIIAENTNVPTCDDMVLFSHFSLVIVRQSSESERWSKR